VARPAEHRELATGEVKDGEGVRLLVRPLDAVREDGLLAGQPQAWFGGSAARRPRQLELDDLVNVKDPLAPV
jgi:hypothetical protein